MDGEIFDDENYATLFFEDIESIQAHYSGISENYGATQLKKLMEKNATLVQKASRNHRISKTISEKPSKEQHWIYPLLFF